MIEIICNSDDSDKDGRKSKDKGSYIRRPKNIKQIGDVSSDKKIYIEDYAFTYINSIAYNNPGIEQTGVLLGEFQKDSEEKCVFVKGVIKAKLTALRDEIHFDEVIWNGIYLDIEKYFPNLTVVGWFAVLPGINAERMARLRKLHIDNFAGAMKTLYLVDTEEKEESFFLYENGGLKKQKGYVCFYERNYEMQEYMLEKRESKSSEENGQDKVMKSIRNVIKEKEEQKQQKKSSSFMYGISTFLVVVILVIGINLMNSYEKMKKFDKSINTLMIQMSGNNDGNLSQDTNTITVNKLSGDVYPIEDETVSGEVALEESSTENITEKQTREQPTETSTYTESVTEVATEDTSVYIYTVKSGDTLMSICKRYYGTSSKYTEVASCNGISDGNYLYVGQQIKLP